VNATQIFQIAATGLGIVGVISAAAVIMRSTVMAQNNTQLRNAYKDQRDQNGDLEKALAQKTGEAQQLTERVQMLEGMVTGRDELAALAKEVATLRASEMASLIKHVGTLGQNMGALVEELTQDGDADRGAAQPTRQALRPTGPRRPHPGDSAGE
jgi:hypothetical protein